MTALARSAAPSSGELWSESSYEKAIVLADRVSMRLSGSFINAGFSLSSDRGSPPFLHPEIDTLPPRAVNPDYTGALVARTRDRHATRKRKAVNNVT